MGTFQITRKAPAMRIILFLATLPDIIRGECKDTGNGAKDYENNGCDWYTIDPRITDPNWLYHNNASCGRYDDDDFKAHKMCCECKDHIYETIRVDVKCNKGMKFDEVYGTPVYCAEACEQNVTCKYFVHAKKGTFVNQCYWMFTADCPGGFENDNDFNFYKRKINIVDEAKTNAKLTKFVGAIENAGLVEELKGDGPFTVFAPINDAFEAKKDELEKEDLKKILLRHVVPEKLRPYDIPMGITTKQTAGDENIDVIKAIFPAKNHDTPSIVIKSSEGNGIVINQPIEALNGVIHIVNEIF